MDIKTVIGFIMVGTGFLFQAISNHFGINGSIETAVAGFIATGLFLISGKEIISKKK